MVRSHPDVHAGLATSRCVAFCVVMVACGGPAVLPKTDVGKVDASVAALPSDAQLELVPVAAVASVRCGQGTCPTDRTFCCVLDGRDGRLVSRSCVASKEECRDVGGLVSECTSRAECPAGAYCCSDDIWSRCQRRCFGNNTWALCSSVSDCPPYFIDPQSIEPVVCRPNNDPRLPGQCAYRNE